MTHTKRHAQAVTYQAMARPKCTLSGHESHRGTADHHRSPHPRAARRSLFDPRLPNHPDHDYATGAALRICRQCPALARCRSWLDGLDPHERPHGVVAGRVL